MDFFTTGFLSLILLFGSVACLTRFFQPKTEFPTKLADIRIVKAYYAHKDSSHFAVTFQTPNYVSRLGIYIGDSEQVSHSTVLKNLNTTDVYSIILDKTSPDQSIGNIGIVKVTRKGEVLYEKTLLLHLFSGIAFAGLAFIVLLRFNKKRQKKLMDIVDNKFVTDKTPHNMGLAEQTG